MRQQRGLRFLIQARYYLLLIRSYSFFSARLLSQDFSDQFPPFSYRIRYSREFRCSMFELCSSASRSFKTFSQACRFIKEAQYQANLRASFQASFSLWRACFSRKSTVFMSLGTWLSILGLESYWLASLRLWIQSFRRSYTPCNLRIYSQAFASLEATFYCQLLCSLNSSFLRSQTAFPVSIAFSSNCFFIVSSN